MTQLFPKIQNPPGVQHIFRTGSLWFIAFLMFPLLMPAFAQGLWDDLSFTSAMECVYHFIIALLAVFMIKDYLEDSFLEVQLNPKGIFASAGIVCALSFIWMILCGLIIKILFGYPMLVLEFFPMTQMEVAVSTGILITEQPLFGSLVVILCTPFSLTGLFYITGFGLLCAKRPWAGYLLVSVLLLLPILFDYFWRGDGNYLAATYLLRLPVHLLACWSWQKTDCVWTPIFSVALFNLIPSLLNILLRVV